MTVFELFKSKSIDELVDWLDENCTPDFSPWMNWWDDNCCKKCDGVFQDGLEYGWCELHGKCKFFQDMNDIPDNKQMIKMWLESEC